MKRTDGERAERLLGQMGRLVVPAAPPAEEAALQRRSAAAVDRLLRRNAEKRRTQRVTRISPALGIAVAAAAAVALALGAWHRVSTPENDQASQLSAISGQVDLSRSTGPVPVRPGVALANGDVLSTAPGSRARVTLADRAALEIGSRTRVRLASTGAEVEGPDQRLELDDGEISLHVPKLVQGQVLSVRTPDALVIVRGTRFSVAVEHGSAKSVTTRVAVSEGRVEVQSRGQTLFLDPGQHWSSPAESGATAGSVAEPAPSSAARSEPDALGDPPLVRGGSRHGAREHARTPKSLAHGSRPTLASRPEAASTLAEENAIYETALRRARSGDLAGALAKLEILTREHSRSPLVQSARVERFRVLMQMGDQTSAAREARRYLSDYPTGFAREEARQIALMGLGDAE
jgi:hypothetical protein